MDSFLMIKPYTVPNDQGYGYANAIYWNVQEVYRGCDEAPIYCNLVNISTRQVPDENGNMVDTTFISPSLMDFQMVADKALLDAWGPDVVIDDYVLTYDPNFERA